MEPSTELAASALPAGMGRTSPGRNWLRQAMSSHMRRWLREPLLHFLIIGAALFAAYAALNRHPNDQKDRRRIVLTENDLSQMSIATLAQGRPAPTIEQMRNLLEAKIREEVLYREALAMGLDKDDIIVKRRMLQKIDFLAEDLSDLREPSREGLQAWFKNNAQRFAYPPRISFRHLYFSFDKHGAKTAEAAATALKQIAGKPADSPEAAALADPFMFRDHYADRSPDQVGSEFGGKFERSVFDLKPGSWLGPLESGFGWHLVFVDSLTPGRVPGFAEVESEVKSEWIKDQRTEFKRKAYEAMKARYEIVLPTERAIEAACSGNPTIGAATNSTPANEIKTNGAPAWMGGPMNTSWPRHHQCALAAPFILVLLLCGLTFASSNIARACALCLAGRTLTISAQELVYAGRSVLALPDAGGKGFRVVEVIKGEHPPGDMITDTVFRADPTAMRSTKPLLLIRDDAWRWWVNFGPIAAEQSGWLRQLAATKRTTGMNAVEWRDHVAYLLPCLENPEPMVAEIAFAEFASAPYAALRPLKPRLDAAAIRKWSNDPTLAARRTLYTLLLGIAGGPQDAEYLEKSLEAAWKSKDSTNLGAELAADLELRGQSRVSWIEEKYLADHDRTMPEIQAALLAMGEQGRADAAIPRWRVIDAYRVFIREHEALAGLVAKDLAEWKCWEFVPKFTAIVHSGGSQLNAYRNGLLYYLVCSLNNDDGMAQPLPANGWLRDPLLYFLVIGAALFAGYSAIRLKQR